MDEGLTYGKALEELESIISKMQGDNCDIDNLAAYTTRASELIKYCREKLFTTDQEIKKCMESLADSLQ